VRRVVLGLGNPGEPYRATRHNVGFRVVEELARRRGVRLGGAECGALTGVFPDPGGAAVSVVASPDAAAEAGQAASPAEPGSPAVVLLAQPQLYMNRSGYAAHCLAERHGLAPGDFLVVYDEVNLPLGKLRLRRGGSPAGHRGMASILESLQTDEVPRLRLGVGPEEGFAPGADLVDFVLGPFAPEEKEEAEAMIARAADACEAWLTQSVEAAMNAFNR
jgi:peptidyl-tRNA hydrolase, PTH1 family